VHAAIIAMSLILVAHGLFHLKRMQRFFASSGIPVAKHCVQDILRFRLPVLQVAWAVTTLIYFAADWALRAPFQHMFVAFFPTQVCLRSCCFLLLMSIVLRAAMMAAVIAELYEGVSDANRVAALLPLSDSELNWLCARKNVHYTTH